MDLLNLSKYSILFVWFCVVFTAHANPKCSLKPPVMLRLANCTGNVQPGVESWGAQISAGDGQNICAMPSTFTPNIFFMGTDLCKPGGSDARAWNITFAQCQSRRGGTFNYSEAHDDNRYSYESTSDLESDHNWQQISGDSKEPFGRPGLTTLSFADDITLSDVTVSTIVDGQNQTATELGIEFANATIFKALKQVGYPSDGWGLNAGSTSVGNPRSGNIVFGGYDPNSVRGSWTSFPINNEPGVKGDRHCPLEVEIGSIAVLHEGSKPGNASDYLIDPTLGGVKACIEPYDNLFRLSQTALDKFTDITGYKSDNPHDPNFFVAEPGLVRPSPFGFSLAITLINGDKPVTFEIPNEELEQPRRGINRDGKLMLQNKTEARIFFKTVLNRVVLGKAFLSQVYIRTQFSKGTFELAPIVTDPVEPEPVEFGCSSAEQAQNVTSNTSGLKKGLIALGAVLGVVLVLVVFLLIVNSHNYSSEVKQIITSRRPSLTLSRNGSQSVR